MKIYIDKNKCIRCYACNYPNPKKDEVNICPVGAIKIKR